MDLKKFLPGHEKKASGEHFCSLVIEPGWVQSGIWKIEDEKVKVVSIGPPSGWELDSELVNSADATISSATQELIDENIDISKTVFGVSQSWVTGGEIKEEFLEKIKRICTDLSLSPVGFVVIPEAISHFIKFDEGAPLSALLIGIYDNYLEISCFKSGNLVGTTLVARSVSIVDDVAEGLVRFTEGDYAPSRFILYNEKEGELEEVKQTLLKVNWDDFENIKFLHTPKIEVIDQHKKVNSISLAGASEMAGVNKVENIEKKEGNDQESEDYSTLVEEDVTSGTPTDFGFVVDKDVLYEETKTQKEEIGENFTDENYSHENVRNVEEINIEQKDLNKQEVVKKFSTPNKAFKNILGFLSNLALVSYGKKTFVLGFVSLSLIFGGGFLWWWFYPKAVVTIYISPKRQDERLNIFVDPSIGNSKISEFILKGEEISTEVSGEKTKSTTGVKLVGDKAKGEVTIYRVGNRLTLDSGTIITGPENLKFSLDEEVTLATGSAGSPGTTKAKVTALDLGSQYNLASGTVFTISNFSTSDMEAKNDTSFSGGTSREINSVSSDDQKELEKELQNELTEKIEKDLERGISSEKIYVEGSLNTKIISKSFDKKVGDEGDNLKISLTIEAKIFVIDKKEILDLVSETFKNKLPEGYVLRNEQIDISFVDDGEEKGLSRFKVLAEANLLPKMDTEVVANRIKGKYPALAREFMVKEIAGFVRAEIKMVPPLPGRLNTLPRLTKNIDIVIVADK